MTNKKSIIYLLFIILILCIGLSCGYFLFNGYTSGTVRVSVDFSNFFAEYWDLIKIILLEFIFGFSILSTPVCFLLLLHQGLIYGYSIFFILNSINRIEMTVFYIIIYLLILSVYTCTSMMSVSYSKTMTAVVPNIKEIMKLDSTHKYIKRFIICSGLLLLLQLIKMLYLILFY